MPIVTRKRRMLSHVGDVFVAPFAFIAAASIQNWWKLSLCGAALLIWLCVTGKWGDLCPSQEAVIIGMGTILFIAIAAVPLAIRDYFTSESQERVWIPGTKCVAISTRFAKALLAQDFRGAFDLLHSTAQARVPFDEFISSFTSAWESFGYPDSINDVTELQLEPTDNPFEHDDVAFEEVADATAATDVLFSCSHRSVKGIDSPKHLLRLYLKPDNDDYRLVAFNYKLTGSDSKYSI